MQIHSILPLVLLFYLYFLIYVPRFCLQAHIMLQRLKTNDFLNISIWISIRISNSESLILHLISQPKKKKKKERKKRKFILIAFPNPKEC